MRRQLYIEGLKMAGRAKKKNGFNRRVARRIKALGLRAVDVADAIGASQGYISHLRSGYIQSVNMDVLFKLADALHCDARWLATGEEVAEGVGA
jgi:transcriptional regulator with XRE-family HTH domain